MSESNSNLRKILYDIVKEITDAKQGVVEPCVAHISEIRNSLHVEVMETLRTLCREGVLSVCLDVNKNPMFKVITPSSGYNET